MITGLNLLSLGGLFFLYLRVSSGTFASSGSTGVGGLCGLVFGLTVWGRAVGCGISP